METAELNIHRVVAAVAFSSQKGHPMSLSCAEAQWNAGLVVQWRCCILSATQTTVWCREVSQLFVTSCSPEELFSVSAAFSYHSAFAFSALLWEGGLAGKSACHQWPQFQEGNYRSKMRCEILSKALHLLLGNQKLGGKQRKRNSFIRLSCFFQKAAAWEGHSIYNIFMA